jgi:GDP-L-fucose synthase
MEPKMSDFWKGKRVIVTGGGGFLGWPTVLRLRDAGADVVVPRSHAYDLREQSDVEKLFSEYQDASVVFHLAATVGGIGFSRTYPAQQIYDGLAMGINVVEAARHIYAKVVFVGSVCSYPKFTPVPFKESSLWDGYPEETNAAYGISKRAILSLLQAYHQQYGMCCCCLLPTNMYGPRDSFDAEYSHVIPALIRKAIEARGSKQPLSVWGTGAASRDFLYVHDAADALLLAGELVDTPEPINLGSGEEVSVADLVSVICDLVGYDGPVLWDSSKPDGQPRRCLDVSKASSLLGWTAHTPLSVGLKETIGWYNAQRRY